jgi:hypothetical protein
VGELLQERLQLVGEEQEEGREVVQAEEGEKAGGTCQDQVQAGVYARLYRQGQRMILARALSLHRQRPLAELQAQLEAAAAAAIAAAAPAAEAVGEVGEAAATAAGAAAAAEQTGMVPEPDLPVPTPAASALDFAMAIL